MADLKITSLAASSTLAATDIVPIVTDIGTVPANKKITGLDFARAILPLGSVADVPITNPGGGLIVTTPDGAHTYRIAVSNSGEVTSEQIS